jgi:uncharacterized tellurite resistance protein B-like protein
MNIPFASLRLCGEKIRINMFDTIRKILRESIPTQFSKNDITSIDRIQRIEVATCALFIEIANADDEFTNDEKTKIVNYMQQIFHVSEEYVHDLMEMAQENIKDSVSIYEFTTLVNEHFSQDEKFEILINLWKLIFADGVISPDEDHLIKKIGSNLHFSHKQIIDAKLIAKQELGKE